MDGTMILFFHFCLSSIVFLLPEKTISSSKKINKSNYPLNENLNNIYYYVLFLNKWRPRWKMLFEQLFYNNFYDNFLIFILKKWQFFLILILGSCLISMLFWFLCQNLYFCIFCLSYKLSYKIVVKIYFQTKMFLA